MKILSLFTIICLLCVEQIQAQKTYKGRVTARYTYLHYGNVTDTINGKKVSYTDLVDTTVSGVSVPKAKIYLRKDTTGTRRKYVGKTDENGYFSFTISQKLQNKFDYVECKRDTFKGILPFRHFYKLPQEPTDNFHLGVVMKKVPLLNVTVAKPAIYLYPEQETKIQLKLRFKGKIHTTYPKYENGWSVKAQPDGKITNLKDNRVFEYLFWDGDIALPQEEVNLQEGWVIKQDETVDFLQNKLQEIGLNNKEINDFIVYWLPQLEQNTYNFIRFCVNDNYHNTSFLEVLPQPTTQIRVIMEFLPLSNLKNFPTPSPQQILPTYRKGFTLVEWGGVKLSSQILKKVE